MSAAALRHGGGRPQPRESATRCAMRAQLRDDPMIGTGFPAARLLLVEQPGPWGRDGLVESRMQRAVAGDLLARASSAGIRMQAIRRPGRTRSDEPRRWALADTRDGFEQVQWGTFERPEELLRLAFDGLVGQLDPDPLYLVCAHGRHDACCALRGRNVAAALDAVRPGRVWETTHVGGDRFAANVLVLPAGLLYGRVLPFAAPGFVAAAEADQVIGALLRGRVGYPPTVQAAMAFALEHLALRRRTDVRLIQTAPLRGGVAVVRLAVTTGLVDVTVRAEPRTADGLTCAAPGPGRFVAYRAVGLTAVAED